MMSLPQSSEHFDTNVTSYTLYMILYSSLSLTTPNLMTCTFNEIPFIINFNNNKNIVAYFNDVHVHI